MLHSSYKRADAITKEINSLVKHKEDIKNSKSAESLMPGTDHGDDDDCQEYFTSSLILRCKGNFNSSGRAIEFPLFDHLIPMGMDAFMVVYNAQIDAKITALKAEFDKL